MAKVTLRGKVGSNKTYAAAFVTGDAEVDAVLAQFEPKFQRKYGRKAAGKAAKLVLEDFTNLASEDTGVMVMSATTRAAKRSRKYAFGRMVVIDREKLFALAEEEGKELSPDKKRGGEPYFYPMVIEFGDHDTEAQKPLRMATYGNEAEIRKNFLDELRRQIAETKP